MPLADDAFDEEQCVKWVRDKEAQWEMHGYGPWAFIIDSCFAGWGGLQYENGDAELALVLHPDYWGHGWVIFQKIISQAFGQLGLDSITIFLPITRKRIRSLHHLGFTDDGAVDIDGVWFNRYRLLKSSCYFPCSTS